ncbi:MAG TPA: AMP-binding protein, partial [Actinomycetota bacterium]|nr:AMP-binding protein [Actinomycetota bacterium]
MDFNVASIGFWLSRRAELSPDNVAVDFEDETITYQALNERSKRAADVLGASGVRKGDRVAVLSENRPEYLEIFFACAKIGAVLAPVSWRLTGSEISWQVEDSEPALMISSEEWAGTAEGCFSGRHLTLGDGGSYESHLASASFDEPESLVAGDDPIMILYTSGTTGRPKGAVLTHANFFWANLNMIINSDIRSDDVSLMFLPMFHIGGWNVNTLSVMLKGGTVVLEKGFEP